MLADKPMFRAKAPIVKQDFDFIHESECTTVYSQVKYPSLSDLDHDGVDGDDADIILGLTRWGDLRVAR